MKFKILSFLILSTLLIPTGSAQGGQLQDNLEEITKKLASTLQENASLLGILTDLELSADIAADDKDIDEIKRIKDLVTELIDKQKVVEKELPPLKKSLDEDCIEARKDKSETADAIDTIGACEDAESVYVAAVSSSKSFKESQKSIEASFAKFGLALIEPTPIPTPSQSTQPTPTPTPSQSTQPAAVTSKKPTPLKKTTITCIKGKVNKKVTGLKPKCPSGYKIKN